MSKRQVCAKGFPNRFRNGREKPEQADKQTERHFRIYINRDYIIQMVFIDCTFNSLIYYSPEI